MKTYKEFIAESVWRHLGTAADIVGVLGTRMVGMPFHELGKKRDITNAVTKHNTLVKQFDKHVKAGRDDDALSTSQKIHTSLAYLKKLSPSEHAKAAKRLKTREHRFL